jgi:neutral ceramidase
MISMAGRSPVLNFAYHPVTPGAGNRLISADFPGAFIRHVQAQTGATALFANGACADINPAGLASDPIERDRGFELVEAMEQRLAEAASTAWPSLEPVTAGGLRIVSRSLALPLMAAPSQDELATFDTRQRADMEEAAGDVTSARYRAAVSMREWAAATARIQSGRSREHVTAEIQIIAVGDIALVGVPGECFTSLGQQIKQGSPFRHTHVLTFANGNVGYIPTREAYPRGGYEVDIAHRYYGYSAPLAPEAGEMIVATALELLTSATEG